MQQLVTFFNHLGPGIIAASAAIGTSHLVQSTRAGAYYGFELIGIILLINILKYPFIENGFRYTSATGENLLSAYYQLNKYYLFFFFIVNIIATLGGISLLIYVTAGIAKAVLGLNAGINTITFSVLVITIAMVIFESYEIFDKLIKIIMVMLLFSTLLATIMAIFGPNLQHEKVIYHTSAWSKSQLPFVIALMGWMPGPVELGVWYSLWLQEKNRGPNKLDFQASKIDFNFGYILIIVTAIFFTTLGALVLRYSGEPIARNAGVFASQLLSIYTSTIGQWSAPLIGTAMLTTILSTTISLIDIYPRSLSVALQIMMGKGHLYEQKLRKTLTLICGVLAYCIVHFLFKDLTTIADIITSVSFLCAPFFAFLNHQVVNSKLLPQKFHPQWPLKTLSVTGLIFLTGFSALFLVSKIL